MESTNMINEPDLCDKLTDYAHVLHMKIHNNMTQKNNNQNLTYFNIYIASQITYTTLHTE